MKSYKVYFFLIFLVLFSFQGCEKNISYSVSHEHYDLSGLKYSTIDEIFCEIELVPLFFEGETYPNGCHRIVITDSLIIITDRNQGVHTFNTGGHYLSCSKVKYGSGPGEYDILMRAFSDKKPDEVTLLTPSHIITYDRQFNTLKTSRIPTESGNGVKLYGEGYYLGNNQYFLLPTPESENPERLDIYDMEKEEIINTFPYPRNVFAWYGIYSQLFFNMPDSTLLFCPPAYTDVIYQVKETGLEPYISFSYDNGIIDKDRIDNFLQNSGNLLDFLSGIPDVEIPISRLINSKKIFTEIRRGNSGLKEWYSIISDRESGKSMRIEYSDGENYLFPSFVWIDEDYVYAVYTKEFLLSNPTLLLNKKDSAEEGLKDIEGEDLVLLKYKFCE